MLPVSRSSRARSGENGANGGAGTWRAEEGKADAWEGGRCGEMRKTAASTGFQMLQFDYRPGSIVWLPRIRTRDRLWPFIQSACLRLRRWACESWWASVVRIHLQTA